MALVPATDVLQPAYGATLRATDVLQPAYGATLRAYRPTVARKHGTRSTEHTGWAFLHRLLKSSFLFLCGQIKEFT